MKIKVGSRDSFLAIEQTKLIINEIKLKYNNIEFEIIPIKTKGDKILDISLDKIGGKGLFINELEKSLLSKEIDMAVHSMKDIPIDINENLTIAAYSKREDARDVFISNKYDNIKDMTQNSFLGTSSLRRKIQALNINPNLNIKLLRGNIITRLNKLETGEYDAIILAMAGLKRLSLDKMAKYIFPVDEMVPAICQGILGIEIRKEDSILKEILNSIDDKISRQCAKAERTFMKMLNGDCTTPIGAYAQINNSILTIEGFYYYDNHIKKYKLRGNSQHAKSLGSKLAKSIKKLIND